MNWRKVMSRFAVVGVFLFLISFIAPENSRAAWVHSLVVDLADADWTLAGEDNGDWTAYFASPAGDVNGDGLGDALIGAPMGGEKICPYPLNPDGSCPGLPKGQGVAYLVLGRRGDLAPDPINLEQADASFIGCEINSMFARQLYTAGDVNGDGYDDILISGWKCGENYRGKAYLYLGRPDVDHWGRFFPVEGADASFLGENEWDFLSYYTATAGDVNGDGYDDILITSTHHEYDQPCPPGASEDCKNCCKNFTATAESFSIESDSWVITSSMNIERINHTALQLGSMVLVAGGQNAASYLDSFELFDTQTGGWEFTGDLTNPRSKHTMSVLTDDKALVAGGQNASGYLNSAEIFDIATRTWVETGSLAVARSSHTATILSDGKILVVGGQNASGALISSEIYDPVAGNWTSTGSLGAARYNHTATLLPDGRVIVIGGQNDSGILSSIEFYDPTTGSWTSGENLKTARTDHTATLLVEKNSLIVAGGQDEGGALYSSELLDLNSGAWSNTDVLTNSRIDHTATLLPDGRVMAVGGYNLSGTVSTYEFYDPNTATWTIGDSRSINYARVGHTTVLLDDGKVLVAGGRNCTDFGKVYLILGRPEADWGLDFDLAQADASFLGEGLDDHLGRSATGIGDVNGDGYDDFLIGAKSSDYAANNAGQNYLFLGRAIEGDPRYDPSKPWWGNDYSVAQADGSFIGEAAGDESGRRVAAAGDVNGDSLDDMLMQAALNDHSAMDAGITYLVLGRRAADWGMRYSLAQADASFVGENKRDQSGRRMSGAGDVNNDGYDDFLTGAPHNEDGSIYEGIIAGKSYLIYGRPEADWGLYFPLSMADVIHIGKPEIGVAGYDNAWLDDFNGDGIDDYLIAAYGGRNNDHVPGEAYILLGSETPVPAQFFTDANRAIQDLPIRFTTEYWEPNGWQDIQLAEFALEDLAGGGTGFYVSYNASENGLYLFDPKKNTWLGPCTPGESGVLSNKNVQVECKGSRVINDERHTIRILWRIQWLTRPNDKVEGYNVRLRAVDQSGNDSKFKDFSNWPLSIVGVYLPMVVK